MQYILLNVFFLKSRIQFCDLSSLPRALASGDWATLAGRKQTNIKPSPDLDKHWYLPDRDKAVESFKTAQTFAQDPNWKSENVDWPERWIRKELLYLWSRGGQPTDFGNWESLNWQLSDLASDGRILGLSGPRWRFCRFDGDIKAAVAFFAPKKSMTAGWHILESGVRCGRAQKSRKADRHNLHCY